MKIKYLITYILIFMSMSVFGFSEPIVSKINRIQHELLIIGRVISSISLLSIIILFILGKPQWKWGLSVLIGTTLLAGFTQIFNWINS